jgi:hypothetical protein
MSNIKEHENPWLPRGPRILLSCCCFNKLQQQLGDPEIDPSLGVAKKRRSVGALSAAKTLRSHRAAVRYETRGRKTCYTHASRLESLRPGALSRPSIMQWRLSRLPGTQSEATRISGRKWRYSAAGPYPKNTTKDVV